LSPHLSVLLPAYNEAENLAELVPEIGKVLESAGIDHEIVVVDDGSTDGTRGTMAELRSVSVRSIRLRRNSGKSAALAIGIEQVEGEVVALMDADGQDDPEELPRLLAHLDTENLDLVTGRRSVRNDRFVKRTTSKLYNGATAKVTGVPGRDFNSGLKVMRRDLAQSVELYGELHRYIPVLAVWNGFRVASSTSSTTQGATAARSSAGPASGGGSSTWSRSSSSPPTRPGPSTSSGASASSSV